MKKTNFSPQASGYFEKKLDALLGRDTADPGHQDLLNVAGDHGHDGH